MRVVRVHLFGDRVHHPIVSGHGGAAPDREPADRPLGVDEYEANPTRPVIPGEHLRRLCSSNHLRVDSDDLGVGLSVMAELAGERRLR
jgi:hypothetical protein